MPLPQGYEAIMRLGTGFGAEHDISGTYRLVSSTREAGLPPLSILKELRRMKQHELLEEFTHFEAAHSRALWEQVLYPLRKVESDPNWQPAWMEGLRLLNEVREALWKQFLASTRTARPQSVTSSTLEFQI